MTLDPMQKTQETPDLILRRIDAIIQELQELRQVVLVQERSSEAKLATQLYGALGQGTWDEYDPDLDWQRFAQ
ncbi:MAG: hypothetical protein JXA89_18100 [Anaerolineae bacterium]|nr:hypothetical protein [Anaerolineae bacterium]